MSRADMGREQPALIPNRELTEAELESLIAAVESQGLLHAPVGLKSQVMEKTRRMDVQLVVQTQRLSRQTRFFWYSAKITAAAAAAMFLIFAVPQDFEMPDRSEPVAVEMEWDGGPKKTLAEKVDQKAAEMARQVRSLARKLFEE